MVYLIILVTTTLKKNLITLRFNKNNTLITKSIIPNQEFTRLNIFTLAYSSVNNNMT